MRPGRGRPVRSKQNFDRGVATGEVAQPFGAVNLPTGEGEAVRDRRLLRLLWWTLPLAVAMVLGGAGLIGLYLWSATSARAASNSDWSQAEVAYREQMSVTAHFPQPWLSQYNLGTVLLGAGAVDEGLELLNSALIGVPKAKIQEDGTIGAFSYECAVRFNLSAGVEVQGDTLAAHGDDEGALEQYENALAIVSPCQISGAGGGGSEGSEGQGNSDGESDSQGETGSQGDSEQTDSTDGSGSDSPEEQGDQGQGSQDQDVQDQQTGESADRLNKKIQELKGEGEGADSSGEETEGTGSGGEAFEESAEEQERREQLEEKNQQQAEREREKQESYNRNPGTGGW